MPTGWILFSEQATLPQTAQTLLQLAGEAKIFLFVAPMGGGKTTLVKQLCRALGVVDVVHSPTFSLIHEYQTAQGAPIYHFDCYRMQSLEEAIDLDFDRYFDSGYFCFVEWPCKIAAMVPTSHFLVRMELQTPTLRKLTCTKVVPT